MTHREQQKSNMVIIFLQHTAKMSTAAKLLSQLFIFAVFDVPLSLL